MNPIVSAIISSIIDSILESAMAPAPMMPPTAPTGVVRPSFENGPLAVMTPPSNGFARFDSETLRLSASLQIRDVQNRIVMPMAMQQPVSVLYKLDAYGTVQRVWVLTQEEAEVAEELIRQKKSAAKN